MAHPESGPAKLYNGELLRELTPMPPASDPVRPEATIARQVCVKDVAKG